MKREGFKRVQELTWRGANAKFEAVLETGADIAADYEAILSSCEIRPLRSHYCIKAEKEQSDSEVNDVPHHLFLTICL